MLRRKQVMLTAELERWLKDRARREGRSVSAVLRSILEEARTRSEKRDPLGLAAGLLAGKNHASHDQILYGRHVDPRNDR